MIFVLLISLLYSSTSPLSFLKISPSARTSSLGESFTAGADAKDALIYNPAGLLSSSKKNTFVFDFLKYVEDISYSRIGYSKNFGSFATGISINQFKADIIKTQADNSKFGYTEVGEVLFQDNLYSLGFAVKTNQGNIGLNLKYITEKIENLTANVFTADAGFQYTSPNEPWRIGLSIENIIPAKVSYKSSFDLTKTLRFGVVYFYPTNFVSVDYVKYENGQWLLNIGNELRFLEILSFRFGFFWPQKIGEWFYGFTGGAGLKIPVGKFDFYLDYATKSMKEFGYIHKMSFSFEFGF